MATKKELIQQIKKEVKWYAQPRGISSRTVAQLEQHLKEARELGLINKEVQ